MKLATKLAPVSPCITGLDAPLLQLSPLPEDAWTLRDALQGTCILGQSGGGKTSGSGAALAKAFLRSGFGGVVMCAKIEEAPTWLAYAKETGRENDIIRFRLDSPFRVNFLEYEMQRENVPQDVLVSNVVDTLQAVLDVADRAGGMEAASGGDIFWQKAPRLLLTRTIDTLYATTGRVRLSDIVAFLESAPVSLEQMQDPAWQKSSFFHEITYAFFDTKGGVNPPDAEEGERLRRFWQQSYPAMSDRTRSNILVTLQTDLEPLLRPQMRRIFSTDTNLVPEMSHDGKIILLDFPALELNETGVLAQMLFAYLWMRAAQRRKVTKHTRPLFYWADEAQYFLSPFSLLFQSTARSSKTATVLMSQNLPSFYGRIGGQRPEHTVNAMMGNLKTKIFHQNDDRTTNEWAAELIGKTSVWRASFGRSSGWSTGVNRGSSYGTNYGDSRGDQSGSNDSSTMSESGGGRSHGTSTGISDSRSYGTSHTFSDGHSEGMSGGSNQGMQEHWDFSVFPHEFATDLQSGGPDNGNVVTGVLVLPGRRFRRNGKHWMTVGFKQ